MVSTTEMFEYIREAERRFQSAEIKDGSHAAGVFGKAAGYFEAIMRQKLRAALARCGVDYQLTVRGSVPGQPSFTRLTLGQIAKVFGALDQQTHDRLLKCFCDGVDVASFLDEVERVNAVWVEVKHQGREVTSNVALDRVRSMNRTTEQFTV